MGETRRKEGAFEAVEITDGVTGEQKIDGTWKENVYGTYIHGVFDRQEVVKAVLEAIGEKKGIDVSAMAASNHREFKEKQYNLLADGLRKYLDMEQIYKILEAGL